MHSLHSQFVILTALVIHLLLMVFVYTKFVFRFYFVRIFVVLHKSLQFVVTSIFNKAPFAFHISTPCKSNTSENTSTFFVLLRLH